MRMFNASKRMIQYRPGVYLASTLCWAVVEIIPLLPGLLIKAILDMLSSRSDLNGRFWWLVVLLSGVYLGRIVLTYAGTGTYSFYGFSVCGLLRQNLLKAVLSRPGAAALTVSPAEAGNRFRDDVSAMEELVSWLQDVFGKLLCAGIAAGVLFALNARMTLLVCLPLGAVLALVQQLRKRVSRYREAGRKATGSAIGLMGEVLGSIQAIQVAGAEESVIERLRVMSNVRHRAMLRDTLFIKTVDAILNNIVYFGTGLILLVAARAMRAGEFTVGDFALFTLYWEHIADFAHNCGNMLASYHQARVSLNRLNELMGDNPDELVKHEPLNLTSTPPVPPAPVTGSDPIESWIILEVSGLCCQYPGSAKGIRDAAFKVQKGTFTVVTGQVGSGKTTLLRALLGLLPADSGTIQWNGKAVADPAAFFIPPRAAYTAQVPRLFSDTIRNNLLLGCSHDTPALDEAVYSAVLEHDLGGFSEGLDTVVGPRGVRLSGGQIQRVAAARMFASRSQLYVFDDISSALDVETENLLWQRLFEKPGATCIAVSTRPGALRRADQILVMHEGQIVAAGKLDELLNHCPEMRLIYSGEPVPA